MVLMMTCELTFSTRGWGSYGPLGAATRSPRRRRPFHFFSRPGLDLDKESGFAGQNGRTERDAQQATTTGSVAGCLGDVH